MPLLNSFYAWLLALAAYGTIDFNKIKHQLTVLAFIIFALFVPLHAHKKDDKLQQIDKKRLASYAIVANKLDCMSDQQISDLLSSVPEWGSGYGKTASIIIDDVPVFVKKIPLTDLEKQPENIRSTANLFDLPLFYQYGVGSAGFGVWREIAALNMASNWVLTGACKNFPLLYHTRVIERDRIGEQADASDIQESVQYWNNSSTVQNRLESMNDATSSVAVFSENIPQSLHSYLAKKAEQGSHHFDAAVKMADKNRQETASFMANHGMIHFDAHAHNIMTDGHRLYFADFGLAISSLFDLSDDEIAFFELHKNYDKIYVQQNLVFNIFEALKFTEKNATAQLQKYVDGDKTIIHSPYITSILQKYARSALLFEEFETNLRKKSKLTPFPAQKIKNILATKYRHKK